ncbi:TPA: WYL domain-containing protein, partial [Burkholderia stabilis]|nr:WYL domain-containing protein [Burkholderia stabilis]HDR9522789.1 WYL domain-containing protein [Burkholderia stabilis]HDR9539859.1 WYL domain-containing protein [Burkholderia stabilis]HDR9554497.1 WYL domain-containing protein [Burkholderia stabilis]HDR9561043.1 WYL domain-containing protein [Burkholderia stabilis]
MAKRPDTLNTTILAIELLRRIPRNRKVTAAELHEQLQHAGLDRDLRTIQRQLETLCEHFDIECDDRSKPYGYCWKSQSSGLSLPVLSEQEALLLLLAQAYLNRLLPAGVMKSMDGFFEQARRNVGPAVAERPSQQWLQKVRVVSPTQPTLPPRIEDGVFDAVSNALYANLWLE